MRKCQFARAPRSSAEERRGVGGPCPKGDLSPAPGPKGSTLRLGTRRAGRYPQRRSTLGPRMRALKGGTRLNDRTALHRNLARSDKRGPAASVRGADGRALPPLKDATMRSLSPNGLTTVAPNRDRTLVLTSSRAASQFGPLGPTARVRSHKLSASAEWLFVGHACRSGPVVASDACPALGPWPR